MNSEDLARWDPKEAELLRSGAKTGEFDAADVAVAADAALEHIEVPNPDGDGYAVPLCRPATESVSNEYVIYYPTDERIRWYDSSFGINGTTRKASCEQLNDSLIGYRLQPWLDADADVLEPDIPAEDLPPEVAPPTGCITAHQQNNFFDDLHEFVETEQQSEWNNNWHDYVEGGLDAAIGSTDTSGPYLQISSTRRGGGRAFRFQIAVDDETTNPPNIRDEFGLFEDNHVIADTRDEVEAFPVPATLDKVGDQSLLISPSWERIDDESAVKSYLEQDRAEVYLTKLLNPVPYQRRLDVLQDIASHDRKRAVATCDTTVGFSINPHAIPEPPLSLNDSQYQAFAWAIAASDIVCIHGPPGTGKTRTLRAYLKHAAEAGNDVLVTAHSNQAVDNLLVGDSTRGYIESGTLHAMAQDSDINIARVGNNSQNNLVRNEYAGTSVSAADVVGATTSGASQFDIDRFDVAVVDEASQASRPATALAMACAEKLVLAGDHKQLPPFCSDETMKEEEMHRSLFEYFLSGYGDDVSVMLDTQYRMHKEIATFPNTMFYDDELSTADQNRSWTVGELEPAVGIQVDGDEQQTRSQSFKNPDEAKIAAKQVERLVEEGLQPEDIGVIAAYSGQIHPIKSQLRSLNVDDTYKISVDTVDSFQGGEREAIIVSLVRSNARNNSGFLTFPDEGQRRLNVALTRARKRLVVIGDFTTLGQVADHRTAEDSCASVYANLYRYLKNYGKFRKYYK